MFSVLFFLLISMSCLAAQFIINDDNRTAIYENEHDNTMDCLSTLLFDLSDNLTEYSQMNALCEAIQPAATPRVKTGIIFEIILYIRTKLVEDEMMQEISKLKETTELTKDAVNELRQHMNLLDSINKITNFEDKKSFERFKKIVNWDLPEFASYFGWPETLIADAFETWPKKFFSCNIAQQLQFTVCGYRNSKRLSANHKYVLPLGKFSQDMQLYTMIHLPKHALLANINGSMQLISVQSCKFLLNIWHCKNRIEQASCGVENTLKCRLVNKKTNIGTLKLRELNDGTLYITTNCSKYTIQFKNKMQEEVVPDNRHLLIKAPYGSKLIFCNNTIHGKSMQNITEIRVNVTLVNLHFEQKAMKLLEERIEKTKESDRKKSANSSGFLNNMLDFGNTFIEKVQLFIKWIAGFIIAFLILVCIIRCI